MVEAGRGAKQKHKMAIAGGMSKVADGGGHELAATHLDTMR